MSELIEQLASESALAADDFAGIRRHAQRQLMQFGFPDLKTEDWKYTPLRVLHKREFSEVPPAASEAPSLPFGAAVLHFDNGLLDPGSCRLPDGVRLEPVSLDRIEGADYGERAGAFAWLNLARFEQGWRLVIESDLSEPLVLATTTSSDFAAAVHPRLVIDVAENVSAMLVEYQHGAGVGLINAVVDINLSAGASLGHVLYRSGEDSVWIQRTDVAVAGDADYRFHALDTGIRLGRQDLRVRLGETGARAEIDGVASIGSKQHVDYHTAIEHAVGHTESRESFRFLADGTGVGVFNGRIHIHAGADDSHSDLNTANLLLSEAARINTKPELEIHAEEVTASHGATIGQIDDDALFYLRTRGLDAEAAMTLLKYGFAAAPLQAIEPESVRKWLYDELKSVL